LSSLSKFDHAQVIGFDRGAGVLGIEGKGEIIVFQLEEIRYQW